MIKWITVVALLASTERKRYSVSWCHNRSHVDCYVTTLLYDQTMVCVVRRANTDVGGCRDARYSIYDTKKRYLQQSYVFIEHFMALNINATRKLHKIAHHHNTWLNRVLHTLDVTADNSLTGDFRLARPHWNNMARLICNAKFHNPLQMYGWVICFEINCTWEHMSHRVMFAYRCW